MYHKQMIHRVVHWFLPYIHQSKDASFSVSTTTPSDELRSLTIAIRSELTGFLLNGNDVNA